MSSGAGWSHVAVAATVNDCVAEVIGVQLAPPFAMTNHVAGPAGRLAVACVAAVDELRAGALFPLAIHNSYVVAFATLVHENVTGFCTPTAPLEGAISVGEPVGHCGAAA